MRDSANEPFVRNAWYIAAWPEELESGLVARTILNEPLVIFRGPDGKAAALEDRCCHRGAPLSQGLVTGRGVQCGYHGLVFDGAGRCVDIPGQKEIPPQTRVRSYPVVERHKIVWIWMGDPARADQGKLVDYPYHDQPHKWPHKKTTFVIKANYMMMIDNLMDLSHLAYVHRKTIGGNPEAHAAAELVVRDTERGCLYERWMMNSPAPPTYVKAVGFTGRIDRWHRFEYLAPSTVVQNTGAIDAGKGARQNQDQPGLHFQVLHHATPETETSFHYFFSVANGYRQDDPAATEQLFTESYPTFLEDKVIMEAQQARIDREPERDLVPIMGDKALFAARRALRKLIEAERAGVAEAAE
jgi:phenylpropionate dioxygenase-like ring-hydroxylating dioxygenase large terminal subunit